MANKEQQYEYERQRIEAIIRTAKLSGIDVKFQLPQRPHEITVQHVKQLQSVTPEQVLGLKPHEVATPQGPKVTASKGEGVPKTRKQAAPRTRKAQEFHSAVPRQKQDNTNVTPPPRSYYVYGQLQDTLQTFGGPAAQHLERIWANAISKYGYDVLAAGFDNILQQDGALYDAIINLAHYKDFGDNAQAGRGFAAFADLLWMAANEPTVTASELAADAGYQAIWSGLESYAEPE